MLIVPYTRGSASPMRIAEACQGLADFTFLVQENDSRAAPVVPVLRELAPVVMHDGDLSSVLREITPR
jgi:hypothetical protein